MSDDIFGDLSFDDPIRGTEADMLAFALNRSRMQFAWKVGGLDEAALRRPHPPSALTLAGLIKHLAWMEDLYVSLELGGIAPGEPWNTVDLRTDPDWVWRSAAEDSAEYLYALYRGAVDRSRAVLSKLLAQPDALDRDAAWVPWEGEKPVVRRVLIDLHDEYARHVGHADLIRESIDGLVGEDPPR
jgi:uncharacterized protein DUF664